MGTKLLTFTFETATTRPMKHIAYFMDYEVDKDYSIVDYMVSGGSVEQELSAWMDAHLSPEDADKRIKFEPGVNFFVQRDECITFNSCANRSLSGTIYCDSEAWNVSPDAMCKVIFMTLYHHCISLPLDAVTIKQFVLIVDNTRYKLV